MSNGDETARRQPPRLFSIHSAHLLVDLSVLSLAYWLAYLLRFEYPIPILMFKRLAFTWPYVIFLQYAALTLFKVTRFSWRFFGLREVPRIVYALGGVAALLVLARLVAWPLRESFGYLLYTAIPFTVIALDFMLAFLGITGVRALIRLLAERKLIQDRMESEVLAVPTMLVGAGSAGFATAQELARRPDLGMAPVGFVDDDAQKTGTLLHGIPVLGRIGMLGELCARHGARQVLITIADAPGQLVREVTERCKEMGIPVKIIPGLYEIVGGKVNLSRIRSVAITDLLRREQVLLEQERIAEQLKGRRVLVTGAGGSIGSEIVRQVARFGPSQLLLFDKSENDLFHIERELRDAHAGVRLVPLIGDVRDEPRMRRVFSEFRPEVVFHAAAHKHVPMMEANVAEAVKNNILGSAQVARLADEFGAGEFVMISTDKAINPTSVMGATKRAAELFVQALATRSRTKFTAVRFGNVLGSAGSVVPIFREQIARGGPVTVTHPEMKRFFMTIPEACQLVLQAGCIGKGGEVFILDMGEPIRIVELAEDMIRLSGLKPHEDIEIKFTGMRPGEKLIEELHLSAEFVDRTRHPKIFVSKSAPPEWDWIGEQLKGLETLARDPEENRIRAKLAQVVPEYAWKEADTPAEEIKA
ncbi:MAG: polysaccharide biosynthesis protein [Planctomycetota bacterium]|nr:polysaccharide biosynthesis protein [Planctomycetota bacterium]